MLDIQNRNLQSQTDITAMIIEMSDLLNHSKTRTFG